MYSVEFALIIIIITITTQIEKRNYMLGQFNIHKDFGTSEIKHFSLSTGCPCRGQELRVHSKTQKKDAQLTQQKW